MSALSKTANWVNKNQIATLLLASAFAAQSVQYFSDHSEDHKSFLENEGYTDIVVEDKSHTFFRGAHHCFVASEFNAVNSNGEARQGLACSNGAFAEHKYSIAFE